MTTLIKEDMRSHFLVPMLALISRDTPLQFPQVRRDNQ